MGLLRFFLALSVLIRSSSAVFGVKFLPGPMAVQLFFVISGFYMALILHSKYVGAGATWMFYKNRMLRLYPIYLIVMLGGWLWFAFQWIYMGKIPQNNWLEPYREMSLWERLPFVASNWSMLGIDLQCLVYMKPGAGAYWMDGILPNLRPDGAVWGGQFRSIEQAWSIGAEIWFYVLAPLLVRMRSWGLVTVAVTSAALRYWIETWVDHGQWYGYFCFASQLYFFAIGMLLYRYYCRPNFKGLHSKMLFGWGAILLGLSICYGALPNWIIHGLLYPGFLLIIPSLFAWSKNLEWDRKLGNLSYPIYMVQLMVVGVLSTVFKTNAGIIAVPLALVIAWALWRLVDEPLDRYRQAQLSGKKEIPIKN